MLKKGTKAYSILRMKCPKCHEGDFFKGTIYSFRNMGEVKEKCTCCNQKYVLEPAFYQGSYYITYALGVGLFLISWLLQYLLFPSSGVSGFLGVFVILVIVLTPLMYALSKIIWINFFVSYHEENKKE